MQYVVYGIKQCDTVRKALKWLANENIDYRFHDLREDGLEQEQVETWLTVLGMDKVLNKRSTSWRQLSEEQQAVSSVPAAAKLICEHPTLVKRPLVAAEQPILCGFKVEQWQQQLK